MPLTVGTAGHIDHGKTWLVRALTGKDTDRLPEEQAARDLDRPRLCAARSARRPPALARRRSRARALRPHDGRGRNGIDLFLLVIDAGEGARPQTHEHLAILRLLGIDRGVVAVTKSDAVDPETLELAVEEAHELVPGAEVVAVSAKTGVGLDELRAALAAAADAERDAPTAPTRLYVDRVFTLRGIGTVVTGTLWSGTIGDGDVLRVEPAGLDVRVRSVQVHDRAVDAPRRGSAWRSPCPESSASELRRGDALVEPGAYPVTYRLDVALEELAPSSRRAVHGPSRHRRCPGPRRRRGRYAQLRLARPVVAARGDRVVLRAATTVGGGIVLDPLPPRRVDPERLESLERGEFGSSTSRRSELPQPPRRARRRRACRRVGLLARWLEEFRDDSTRAWRRRPARSRDRSAGRSVGGRARAAARRRAPRLTPLPARRDAEAAGGEELLAELSRGRAEPGEGDDAGLARVLEQEGSLVRRRRRLRGRRGRLRAGPGRARGRVHGGRRSRSRASATCSASAGAPPSSCSSASTPTG